MKVNFSRVTVFALVFVLLNLTSFAQTPVKIACIGNSVTFGAGLKNPEKEAYPAQLQQLLGAGYQVRNFGRNGATLLRKGHNPYYKTTQFTDALYFKPDIAIVHLGLNDTDPRNWPDFKDDFEPDYAWLLDTLRKVNPAIKLFVCRLTPIFSGHPRFKSGTRDWYWQIQQRIPQIARANNAELIDLNTSLCNRPDLFPDNLHPVKEGAAIIARTVYRYLTGDFGGLKLPAIFASNMVLQRQQPIPVYGTGNAGDSVEVVFNNRKLVTATNKYGDWKVVFPPTSAGGPYQLTIRCRDQKRTLNEVMVGDVWLCAGQSNMAFPLKRSEHGSQEIERAANYRPLRLLKLRPLRETDATVWDSLSLAKVNELNFFSGSWCLPDKDSAPDFSAVAYFFGKRIYEEEKVPVGLIELAVGGSPAESWIDRHTMEHDERLTDMLDNWRKSDFIMPWCRDRADLNLKNATSVKQRHPYQPCYNYEAGLQNLIQVPIKGAIWYQGESNTHNVELYEHLLPAMVKSWRGKWGYEFPFYFVQLSSIDRPSWPAFREAQRKLATTISNSGMAISLDLGDSLDVHPIKKKEIGSRLALLALRDTYKHKILASGPEPVKAERNGSSIAVVFRSAKQLSTSGGKLLQGFMLVNERGEHLQAKASIKKNKVLLNVPEGQRIKRVVYAWEPYTHANLVNEAGLPASTFELSIE